MLVIGLDLGHALQVWRTTSLLVVFLTIFGVGSFSLLSFYFFRVNNEVKSYQVQLANASKMVAVGEMAAGVAHEINNPLAIIAAAMHAIKRTLNSESVDRATVHARVDLVTSTVHRISVITKGLLSLGQDTSSEPLCPTDVVVLVTTTANLLRPRLAELRIDLSLDLSTHDASVMARPNELSQVLLHLINNAADAVQTLPERWIRVQTRLIAGSVQIRVIDSGAGIAAELRERIFHPFFTTKPIGSNIGLGLTLAQAIVRNHGGELGIEAQAKHTSFLIRLPSTSIVRAA